MPRVIGFNFTKVSAEKSSDFKPLGSSINTNIEFTNVEKESIDILKGAEATKIHFTLSINYNESEDKKKSPEAQVAFEGTIVLATDEKESKDIQESWKNKQIPKHTQLPLFNTILKRSASKALQLQEELNLPSHVQIPQLMPQQSQQTIKENILSDN